MIEPPAAAHVASSTRDGIAVADDCSHGCGGMPTQPRIVLKRPVGLASKTFQSSTATTGWHDAGGRRAPSRTPSRATSLISTATMIGSGKTGRGEQREVQPLRIAVPSSGSFSTCASCRGPPRSADREVGLLQAHDHRLHDRRPAEDREHDSIGARKTSVEAAAPRTQVRRFLVLAAAPAGGHDRPGVGRHGALPAGLLVVGESSGILRWASARPAVGTAAEWRSREPPSGRRFGSRHPPVSYSSSRVGVDVRLSRRASMSAPLSVSTACTTVSSRA